MKRMITALCAMMLVPTLAAAKNEGISVTRTAGADRDTGALDGQLYGRKGADG